jgi:hypothetical protein
MNKYQDIFFDIKKIINYILNDSFLVHSSNYFSCLNEIYDVLRQALYKIENIYYKYVLYPKLCHL